MQQQARNTRVGQTEEIIRGLKYVVGEGGRNKKEDRRKLAEPWDSPRRVVW